MLLFFTLLRIATSITSMMKVHAWCVCLTKFNVTIFYSVFYIFLWICVLNSFSSARRRHGRISLFKLLHVLFSSFFPTLTFFVTNLFAYLRYSSKWQLHRNSTFAKFYDYVAKRESRLFIGLYQKKVRQIRQIREIWCHGLSPLQLSQNYIHHS